MVDSLKLSRSKYFLSLQKPNDTAKRVRFQNILWIVVLIYTLGS